MSEDDGTPPGVWKLKRRAKKFEAQVTRIRKLLVESGSHWESLSPYDRECEYHVSPPVYERLVERAVTFGAEGEVLTTLMTPYVARRELPDSVAIIRRTKRSVEQSYLDTQTREKGPALCPMCSNRVATQTQLVTPLCAPCLISLTTGVTPIGETIVQAPCTLCGAENVTHWRVTRRGLDVLREPICSSCATARQGRRLQGPCIDDS